MKGDRKLFATWLSSWFSSCKVQSEFRTRTRSDDVQICKFDSKISRRSEGGAKRIKICAYNLYLKLLKIFFELLKFWRK